MYNCCCIDRTCCFICWCFQYKYTFHSSLYTFCNTTQMLIWLLSLQLFLWCLLYTRHWCTAIPWHYRRAGRGGMYFMSDPEWAKGCQTWGFLSISANSHQISLQVGVVASNNFVWTRDLKLDRETSASHLKLWCIVCTGWLERRCEQLFR